MNLSKATLLLRTLPYLKAEQIAFRLWYLLRARMPIRYFVVPKQIDLRPLNSVAPFMAYPWINAEDIKRGNFRFLNLSASFIPLPDWRCPDKDRLWRYNLHYFQYLHPEGGLNSETGLNIIENWIASNPLGTLDAWDPFPVSLRLVNWIKYVYIDQPAAHDFVSVNRSAYLQALHLECCLEYHLLGNHLFKNAKALVFAGLYFSGRDANRWLTKGLNLMDRELKEQILPDGGHYERSPMYHSMILEDCLDLLNILIPRLEGHAKSVVEKLRIITERMAGFLLGMVHPDGQITLFNDAAFGIEVPPERLASYYEQVTGSAARKPAETSWAFPVSGYFCVAPTDGDRLFIDCGAIGPDYQPGHAHCDTLSFEMSLRGRRVIVDSGCCQYEDSDIRSYNRGNMGHNTLTIDGENQSEVWGAHRCARRARPVDAKLEKLTDGTLLFEGAHDGYKRLSGHPIHRREIKWSSDMCKITDSVEGQGHHCIESRLHIHPELNVDQNGDMVIIRDKNEMLTSIRLVGDGHIEKIPGWYCPEFGIQEPCAVLKAEHKDVSLPHKSGWIFSMHCQ